MERETEWNADEQTNPSLPQRLIRPRDQLLWGILQRSKERENSWEEELETKAKAKVKAETKEQVKAEAMEQVKAEAKEQVGFDFAIGLASKLSKWR